MALRGVARRGVARRGVPVVDLWSCQVYLEASRQVRCDRQLPQLARSMKSLHLHRRARGNILIICDGIYVISWKISNTHYVFVAIPLDSLIPLPPLLVRSSHQAPNRWRGDNLLARRVGRRCNLPVKTIAPIHE